MKQNFFDRLPLINHRKHSHPVLAMRANQRVGVPNSAVGFMKPVFILSDAAT
jgi:hypothetical protein